METTVQHTCKKLGGKQYVLDNAPFLSDWLEFPNTELNKGKNNMPFLAKGYYFWDYNIEMAREWGEKHYNNSFYVAQYELIANDEDVFDIVGNRKHMLHIYDLLNSIARMGRTIKPDLPNGKISLGRIFHVFKTLNATIPDFFTFSVIKAIYVSSYDIIKNEHKIMTFVDRSRKPIAYINLNPRIIICVQDLNNVHLHNKEIVYHT